jgi:hypothetical protein
VIRLQTSAFFSISVLLLCGGVVACGEPQVRPALAPEITRTPKREKPNPVEGLWRLVAFDSREPLDPPLEGFVSGELGHLEVSLWRGRLQATGTLVHAVCDYEIEEFDGHEFTLTLLDENAVSSAVAGRLEGDNLYFDALEVPWVGTGRLTRYAP